MSDGMGREFMYLSSHATNRYLIPNWGKRLQTVARYYIDVLMTAFGRKMGTLLTQPGHGAFPTWARCFPLMGRKDVRQLPQKFMS